MLFMGAKLQKMEEFTGAQVFLNAISSVVADSDGVLGHKNAFLKQPFIVKNDRLPQSKKT